MTLEELKEKYPVGSKIRVIDDLEKIKEDTKRFGWTWYEEKEKIVGKEVTVSNHIEYRLCLSVDVVTNSGSLWTILPHWIVQDSLKDDPDQLLKKQRDEILASIFGG